MRSLCFLGLGVLLLVTQTTIFPSLPAWIGKPDLLFILVIFLALRMPVFQGAVLTLFFGLLMDIFSGIFLGLYPVMYLVVFTVVQLIARQLAIGDAAYQIPLVVASYLFMNSVVFMGTTMLEPDEIMHWSWPDLLLRLLILAVMAMPLFFIFDWLMGWFDQGRPRWSPFGAARSVNRFATPARGRRPTAHPNRED